MEKDQPEKEIRHVMAATLQDLNDKSKSIMKQEENAL